MGVPAAMLRDAFAEEVAKRLPGMQSAVTDLLATGAPAAARELRTHVHTLASSCALLGEALASDTARRCERLLDSWTEESMSPETAAEVAREVETICLLLSPWLVA